MKTLQHRASLRADGWYANVAESELAQILKARSRNFVRRGYPDFTILDASGDICGFIEVKKNSKKGLKTDQERFRRFCNKYNIPFIRWSPEDGHGAVIGFLS